MDVQKCAFAALVAGLSAIVPAAAQSTDAAVATCSALISRLDPDLRPSSPPTDITPAGPAACRYDGVHLPATSRAGWDVASVVIRGVPSGPIGTEPLAMRVEANGITFALHTGRAAMDWMSRQQQVPFNVTLELTYDPGTKLAVLKEFSMVSETGSASLDGIFENVEPFDPLRPSDIPPPFGSRIKALHIHLESKQFLTSFVLPMVVASIPDGDTGAIVEGMKTMVIGEVRELLPVAPRETVNAITDFVQDFPHPRHPFDLSLQAAGVAFGAGDLPLLTQGRDVQIERLKQLKVEASYAGELR